MKLTEIKTASLNELHHAAGKAILAQGTGANYSQMLENRITKINLQILKRTKL